MLEQSQLTTGHPAKSYFRQHPLPSAFFTIPFLLSGGSSIGGAPLNSMPAFIDARTKYGAGLHLDIRATSDGRLVVFQDASLRRVLGDARLLADVSYRELMTMKISDTSLRVVALEDVIEELGGLPMFLDLRVPGLEENLAKLLAMFPYAHESLVVNSWWNTGMERLADFAPRLPHCRSLGRTENSNWLKRVFSAEPKSGREPKWTQARSPILALDANVFSDSDIDALKAAGAEIFLREVSIHEAEIIRKKLGVVALCSESVSIAGDHEADSRFMM